MADGTLPVRACNSGQPTPAPTRQFHDRAKDFSPIEILSRFVPKMGWFPGPGREQRYCSTNYILLGLVLAAHANASSWTELEQRRVFPASLAKALPRTSFVDAGRCSDHSAHIRKAPM